MSVTSSVTLSCTKHFILSNSNNIFVLLYLTHRTLNFMTANWRIGKDQSAQSSGTDAPQSSQAPPKRKAPNSTKNQPKRQKTVPSFPPHPAPQIQAAPSSPPHPAP